jgi:cell wall-associated NlpC family hydrolase
MISTSRSTVAVAALLLLTACATTGVHRTPDSASVSAAPIPNALASRAADNALAMLGKPYRHSGNTPAGFDCSGLVQYSYSKAGVSLPRETQAQRREGQLVRASELRRGDLVFFDQEGKKSSHVGIYIGRGRFVHAPSTGGRVRTDGLDTAYWRTHFVEARRL